ncbi:MAG: transketolase C-terminal domain-containing protein [Phycisphaerales bacterium]|jgi:transketolase
MEFESMQTLDDIDIRDALFDRIYDIAAKDKSLIFITADADTFSIKKYKKDLPEQFVNVGVAEQNMVAVAAGLALSNKRVFICSIIPFITLRCYEHIKVNICSMNLPVTIIGIGAGLSFSNDGPSHHAVCDVSVMRALPEITIFNPSDPIAASASVRIAYELCSPAYVRLDKGRIPTIYDNATDFSSGLSLLKPGSDLCIVSTGLMTHRALKVAEELSKHSIEAAVVDLYRIKPINAEMLLDVISQSKKIVTLEEHYVAGGIGSIIIEILTDKGVALPLKRIGISERTCPGYGNRDWMHSFYGLDTEGITEQILNW